MPHPDEAPPLRNTFNRADVSIFVIAIGAVMTLIAVASHFIDASTGMAVLAVTTGAALLLGASGRISANSEPTTQEVGSRERARDIGQRTSADTWRSIFDGVPDIMLVLDRNANILHANAAATAFFAKSVESLPLEYVSRQPELAEAVQAVVASQSTRVVQLIERSNLERHMEAVVSPIGGDLNRDAARVLVMIRDRSAHQRLTDMRADFIANASHELRTPLASLLGFIETLQGPARNDEAARARFLMIMADQGKRMTRLIDDLLLLSRVEERANLAPSGTVELNETLLHVIEVIRPLSDDKNTTISIQRTDGRAEVSGDRDELVQVFVNLIENALKYGHDGGHVTVTLERQRVSTGEAPNYIVAVRDNGPGIPPEHLPRLTERFYRVNAPASRAAGGTGLGLAIVKHVLNRHLGTLSINSTVGHGSAFTVKLKARHK